MKYLSLKSALNIACILLGGLLLSGIAYSQTADTSLLSLSTSSISAAPVVPTPPPPKETEKTKIYSLKYAKAIDVSRIVQTLLSSKGKITGDDRTNLLVIVDNPENLEQIDQLINMVDVQLETVIIPIKFGDADDIYRLISRNINSKATLSVDQRMNSIIITDNPQGIAQVKNMIEQVEKELKNRTQVGLDCSIIKLTLGDSHSTGIDWNQCPYPRKGETGTAFYMQNMDIQGILNWFNKFGTAELLSRKRVTLTPNEETRFKDGVQYYQGMDRTPAASDTTGKLFNYRERFEIAGFTYRFVAKKGEAKDGKGTIIMSYNIDGVIPQKSASVAYSVNVNNAQVETGTTLVNEDVRQITVVDDSNPGKTKYDNLNIILLVTPYSLVSNPKDINN